MKWSPSAINSQGNTTFSNTSLTFLYYKKNLSLGTSTQQGFWTCAGGPPLIFRTQLLASWRRLSEAWGVWAWPRRPSGSLRKTLLVFVQTWSAFLRLPGGLLRPSVAWGGHGLRKPPGRGRWTPPTDSINRRGPGTAPPTDTEVQQYCSFARNGEEGIRKGTMEKKGLGKGLEQGLSWEVTITERRI